MYGDSGDDDEQQTGECGSGNFHRYNTRGRVLSCELSIEWGLAEKGYERVRKAYDAVAGDVWEEIRDVEAAP